MASRKQSMAENARKHSIAKDERNILKRMEAVRSEIAHISAIAWITFGPRTRALRALQLAAIELQKGEAALKEGRAWQAMKPLRIPAPQTEE